jgi:hypothetical protein
MLMPFASQTPVIQFVIENFRSSDGQGRHWAAISDNISGHADAIARLLAELRLDKLSPSTTSARRCIARRQGAGQIRSQGRHCAARVNLPTII